MRPARAVSRPESSEATRRAILDAAGEILSERGEDGLAIREVCARAGVTPPTIYHHFGDKAALVIRVVDDCFAELDQSFARRAAPADPVEALAWAFDRYVEYGCAHPVHYRLMFERRARPTPGGMASYDRLRQRVTAIASAGRLVPPVEDATAAFWSAAHGVTSLLIHGFWQMDSPAVRLVREAMLTQLTHSARSRPAARPAPGRDKETPR